MAVFFCITGKIIYAQPGKPDLQFGNKGIVTTDIGRTVWHNGSAKKVLFNSDGSTYVILEIDGGTVITKKRADGSADSTYGRNGFSVKTSISGTHAVMQADGKIVIAGTQQEENYYYELINHFAIARMDTSGNLDPTFGYNGLNVSEIGDYYDAINSVSVQNDGKIVVSGINSTTEDQGGGLVTIARYTASGSLDGTFNQTGILITDWFADQGNSNFSAIQNDGKIILASTVYGSTGYDFSIARFNSDGTTDAGFIVNTNLENADALPFFVTSLVIQQDGKIVVGGLWQTSNTDFVLARFNVDGGLDHTFSNDGIQTTDFRSYKDMLTSLSIQSDKKIVAAGYASNGLNYGFAIARYNVNGDPDNTFDVDGKKLTYIGPNDIFANSLTIQNNGKLLLCGYSNENNHTDVKMAKYKTDGTMDSSFAKRGTLTDSLKKETTQFTSTVVQSDGKIVAAGYSWNGTNTDIAIARYLPGGALDNTFSLDGKQNIDLGSDESARSVVQQTDGKIVTGGGKALARFNTNGNPDNSFNHVGYVVPGFDISFVKLQTDGKIIAAGGQTIARYNTDGSPDAGFNGNGMLAAGGTIKDIAIQKDGKIIILVNGDFTITRYNINGSADITFQTPDFFPDWVDDGGYDEPYQYSNCLALQSDGKIVVGGYAGFTGRYSYNFDIGFSRFNINGKIDSSFGVNGNQIVKLDPNANSMDALIAIEPDDKIVVEGLIYKSESRDYEDDLVSTGYGFARLNSDGSRDLNFGADSGEYVSLDHTIKSITTGNNKLYSVGYSTDISDFGFVESYYLTTSKSPQVTLTAPANNAVYTAPANVTLNATASDPDGTITSVQFFNGSTLLKADSTSPYSFTLTNLAAGSYSFVAKATNNHGLVSNSATVAVTVLESPNKAPFVSITNPVTNSTYVASSSITINAAASDADGTITNVKFYNGPTLLATDSTSPYSYTISNAATGSYKFYVQATDDKGLKSSSSTVSAFVVPGASNKAPAVSITSPANNANYPAVATIVLHAAASDADGTVTSVNFYNGSTLLKADSTSPYSCTVTHPPTGSYTFVAKATDNNGLVSNSATINVTVGASANKAPVVSITGPVNNAGYVASSTIILNATASDPDGSVSSVKFYNESSLLKTVTTGNYSDTIYNVAAGSYKFYAKAIDNNGAANSSSTVSVFVVPGASNKAPAVKLTNPANNAIHYAPATIFLSADASDQDGTIANVKFYMGSTLVATDSVPPYSFTLTNLPVGNYSLVAKATDNDGLQSNSATSFVSVLATPNKAPGITLTSPANNAVYTAPASITLNATANDADGTIRSVKFYNGSTLLKTVNTFPYSYTMNNVAAGSYKFYAKATDNNGSTNSSATSTVLVNTAVNNIQLSVNTVDASTKKIFALTGTDYQKMKYAGVTLAPNPVHTFLNITITGLQNDKQSTISVISVTGAIVKTMQLISFSQSIPIDVSSLTSGMYIVKITDGHTALYRHFIKL